MPPRNVVQDSDDDEDVDTRISPTKVPEPRSEVDLNIQNDGMEYVDFGSPSPPCAVSTSEDRPSTGAGSSGKLSTRHQDLRCVLGDDITSQLIVSPRHCFRAFESSDPQGTSRSSRAFAGRTRDDTTR